MQSEITLYIILSNPFPNVVYGLQKGSGNDYETIQKQRSNSRDLSFSFTAKVKGDRQKDLSPKLSGDFVQGPTGAKFVYIDVGTYAGQADTGWARRLKIPLTGITWNDIDKLKDDAKLVLETSVPGTGKDGGPNCATVKPFGGWHCQEL